MNMVRKSMITVLAASALVLAPLAQARMSDRTTATIVGAAVGGVIGSAAGNNMESTLIGAALGGTAGNLYAKRNQKRKAAERVVYRDITHHHHHYYGHGNKRHYGPPHAHYKHHGGRGHRHHH
ncbi:glycine zipper domain-containing protein [Neisseria musculi]|uniref:Glycine zipper family protein n=1 Tax=Neisseria musculi TaxID=1815583 RepID=A0A7H1M8W7_9NEIS|nr:glycine zipper domain-containing protein [Neisseria musculi]QNT58082.1 glycine zipper family protein [Neisseria musculi]